MMIRAVPHIPTNDDPEDPAFKLGLAPKKSNFSIMPQMKLKMTLTFDCLFFES
jgi:hypothetical protein